jgi:hypothetical protein
VFSRGIPAAKLSPSSPAMAAAPIFILWTKEAASIDFAFCKNGFVL